MYVLVQGMSVCTEWDRDSLLMYELTVFPFISPSRLNNGYHTLEWVH